MGARKRLPRTFDERASVRTLELLDSIGQNEKQLRLNLKAAITAANGLRKGVAELGPLLRELLGETANENGPIPGSELEPENGAKTGTRG